MESLACKPDESYIALVEVFSGREREDSSAHFSGALKVSMAQSESHFYSIYIISELLPVYWTQNTSSRLYKTLEFSQ